MNILGLAESFIIWTDPTVTFFEGVFLEVYDIRWYQNLHSNLKFVLSKFEIDIFDSLETMRFSAT